MTDETDVERLAEMVTWVTAYPGLGLVYQQDRDNVLWAVSQIRTLQIERDALKAALKAMWDDPCRSIDQDTIDEYINSFKGGPR